jgi:effector-binding domain-containing protein
MLSEPRIEERPAQAYVGVRTRFALPDFPATIDRTLGELWSWVGAHGLAERAGPPTFRYLAIDMERELEVEFCIPLTSPADGDDRVKAGTLPAGRYATVLYTGQYDGLRDATAQLVDWGRANDVTWKTDADGNWLARLEIYLSDPSKESDPSKLQTQLAFMIDD